MIVYIPLNREDTGLTVLAVPSEQLVYVSHKRCLRKTKDGYNTDYAINTDYIFIDEYSAWNFLMKKDITDEHYVSRKEIWPNKYFNETKREKTAREKHENNKPKNRKS